MNIDDFETLVHKSYDNLPEEFRQVCDGVILRVEDYADEEVLTSLGMDNPMDLLGLYHGVNLMQKSVYDLPGMPDMVMIYREPIIAFAKYMNLPLDEVVEHVVVHEYGHHLGYSDEDMDAINYGRHGFYHKGHE